MKKKITLVLFGLILLVAAGCGRKEKNPAAQETARSREYVYRMEDLEFGEDPYSSVSMIRSGEEFLTYEYVWPEDGGASKIHFNRLTKEGEREELFWLEGEEDSSYNDIASDGNNLYLIRNKYYNTGEIDEETGEVIAEGEYRDEYYLVKMTMTGEEVFSVLLNDIPELKRIEENQGWFSAYGMLLTDDSVYISCSGIYARFDKEGNLQKIMGNVGEENDFNSANFIPLMDGRVAALLYEENGASIAIADMENGSIGEKHTLPGAFSYSFYPGIGYDLYITDTSGMYGYNIGDEEPAPLLNFVDSDIACWGLNNVLAVNEKEFYAYYDEMDTGQSHLARFTKVDPADVKEKKIITLAMAYTDWGVRSQVIKFNKADEEYRITIQDYSSYATEDDYNAGITRLNADIVSGKVPDILLLHESMPVESYMSKGLFEDLNPYIEKDSELDINNYMPNIMEAFSRNGKLYVLVPNFSIQTLVAKTSEVGPDRGWTVQEAMALWDSKPEGTEFLNATTRDEMLSNCMRMASSQFIDPESGKCSFDSAEFIQMLEFINRFPQEIDENYYTDQYWQNYDSQWREGRVLTSYSYIGDFRNYNNIKKGTFGEDITLIGFPSSDGDGSVIVPGNEFALSSKSKDKEGAWKFLRTFITDEYQSEIYGFTLSIKQLKEQAKQAMQRPYYEDENGNKVEYDDYVYIGDVEITIDPITQQEADDLLDQLLSFKRISKYDEALNQIISEEAAAYFTGQKNAEEVARIIQSRAQIYVNETR